MKDVSRTLSVAWLLNAVVLVAALLLPWGLVARAEPTGAASGSIGIYLFWSSGCPHCTKAKAFTERLAAQEPDLQLRALEVGKDASTDRAFLRVNERHGIAPPAVPLIAVGDKIFVGYDTDATTGAELRAAVAACRARPCPDVTDPIIGNAQKAESGVGVPSRMVTHPAALPEFVRLPLFGSVETRALSLPALTVVLGFVDGFNPCAMWVLVFLIGLLVGMRDPVRMWSYGAVFLLTSAVVYLAFMAAWLNVLMVLGSLTIIRMGIGVFAIGAGGYYLYQFWANPDAACPVTSPGERQRVMTRLKAIVAERSFPVAIAGIVVLATLVNLIELLCSAGIPAIYTQVLALSDLSGPAYAGYLLLYISVFLIDDVIVFVTAMVTLRASGLAATYARYSHLLGGVVLGAIGLLLLFRPQWLAFA